MEQRGNAQVISAQGAVRRRCLGMLATFVRAPRGARRYTMQFDSYQQVPESIAQEIIARVRGE